MDSNNQDFEKLRKLLALKRHEQPPPDYFNFLSKSIILRINSGDKGENESTLEKLFNEAEWLRRLWALLEAKPALASAFGAAICAMIIGVFAFSGYLEPKSDHHLHDILAGQDSPIKSSSTVLNPTPVASAELVSSTNGMAPTGGDLFQEMSGPMNRSMNIQQTGFEVPGGH